MRNDRVLLVGSGGREHAIAESIVRSGAALYSTMKFKNPGIAKLSKEFFIVDENRPEEIIRSISSRQIDIAFVGPEEPLSRGLADRLEEEGIPVVGPSENAARIESSKEFMRTLMKKYSIDGYVEHFVFSDVREVEAFIKDYDKPFVVKPVGLTGGKGVKVMGEHFNSKSEAIDYAKEVITKKIGGEPKVMIEEKVIGEEFTLQVFTDGYSLRPMPLVQDFKRAYEGDLGPNTGGMGSYSCSDHLLPFIDYKDYERALRILEDIITAMRKEGSPFKGIMYGQFMLSKDGPKVIEINCRFGDPEAINLLPILQTDLVEIGWAIVDRRLSSLDIEFEKTSTVVKYVVPEGYGTNPLKGEIIEIDSEKISERKVKIYYASVYEENGKIFTTTSRSIALFSKGPDLFEVSERINDALKYIRGRIFFRKDIATRDVILEKIRRMRELLNN